MTEEKNRYSVKVSTLQGLETMIKNGCYDQAIEIIQRLYDPYERLKDREKKQKAYWAAKNCDDEEIRPFLWAKYKAIMNESIF